jgi:hypothetical protein
LTQAKDKAWEELTRFFNQQSTTGLLRTAQQLKACYKGIKQNARKNLAADKVCVCPFLKIIT